MVVGGEEVGGGCMVGGGAYTVEKGGSVRAGWEEGGVGESWCEKKSRNRCVSGGDGQT